MSWPQAKLEALAADIPNAFVGGPFGSNLTTRDYVESGVPVIRGSNMTGGRYLDTTRFVFVSETKMRRDLSSNLARENDLIFTQRGTLGQVVMIPQTGLFPHYVVSQSQMKLTVDQSKADRRFVYYYFSSPTAVGRITNLASSSGVPHINLTVLRNFELPVPPLDTQRRIADILSAYDDLIENNRRRIALLEQAARELYREWFVRLRFPGHENTRIVDGLPEGWERKNLCEVAVTNAHSYRTKELPETLNYIDISSVSDGLILEKKSMVSADAPGRARRKAAHGDVIWSNVRPNLKAYSLVLYPEENDVYSTGFTVLSATKIPFTFLYQSVTSDHFVTYLVNHTTGSSYPAVRREDFERAEVVVPPPLLSTEFHEVCESKYRLIAKLAREGEQLMRARDLLLPRLMSGEVAV